MDGFWLQDHGRRERAPYVTAHRKAHRKAYARVPVAPPDGGDALESLAGVAGSCWNPGASRAGDSAQCKADVLLAQCPVPYVSSGDEARAVGLRRALAVTEQPSLSFAGLLRQLRGEAKLTQEELAEAVSLNARHLQAIEAGDYWPTLPTIKALRKALKTTWESLCESW